MSQKKLLIATCDRECDACHLNVLSGTIVASTNTGPSKFDLALICVMDLNCNSDAILVMTPRFTYPMIFPFAKFRFIYLDDYTRPTNHLILGYPAFAIHVHGRANDS